MSSLLAELGALAPGKSWIVGGFLRDRLLGRASVDVDLAVDGDALALAKRFASSRGRSAFALDPERGIHRVAVGDGMVVDFCRLQGSSIAEDLGRRDFTINALALPAERWRSHGEKYLIDLFGGRKDLAARRISMVRPEALVEDPLRLLRAFRMGAELDFQISPATMTALRRRRKLILRSAPERVREELMKTLGTSRSAEAFRSMDGAGILSALFPEMELMRKAGRTYYGKGGVLTHSLDALAEMDALPASLRDYFPRFHHGLADYLEEPVAGHPRLALLKMAELFHDVGKPRTAKVIGGKLTFYGHDALGGRMVKSIAGRLRFSAGESKSISRLVASHMRAGNLGHQPTLSQRAIYRYYRDLGSDAVAMLLVSLADHFTYLTARVKKARKDPVFLVIRRMLANHFLKPQTVAPPKIIDGHAVMRALRLKPGPEIGRLLEAVREAQAAGEIKAAPEALALARKLHSQKIPHIS